MPSQEEKGSDDHDDLSQLHGGAYARLAFLFGVLVFSESCTPVRIAGVLLITGGIVSLRSAY